MNRGLLVASTVDSVSKHPRIELLDPPPALLKVDLGRFVKSRRTKSFLSLGWGVLVAGLITTFVVSSLLSGVLRQDRRASFERSSLEIQHRLEERFRLYGLSLLQIQAFAHAKKSVTDRDNLEDFGPAFTTYVSNLDVTTIYPGSRGVGLLEKVTTENRDAHLRHRRSRLGSIYRIWPEGNQGTAFPLVQFEPGGIDPKGYGIDHGTDPIRASALKRALETGSVVASSPTRFLTEYGKSEESQRPWGFFLYAPIFKGTVTPRTLLDRKNALLGYVFTAFRFDYLIPRAVPPPFPAPVQRIQLISEGDHGKIYYDSDPSGPKEKAACAVDLDLGLPGIDRAFFLRISPEPIPFFSHLNIIPLFCLLLGTLLTLALWREVRTRERGRKALEEGIELRTHQLAVLLEEQKKTNAELKLMNEDLESFGYSVSHDLRAPLRGIDGFGAALEEEFSPQLGVTGKRYVDFMRQGALRAGSILDDLLRLSRLSRTEPAIARVDLGTIAEEVIRSFRESEPDRQVDFRVIGERIGHGDAGLIRIAIENLLSNAWKFTRKEKEARIILRGERSGDGEMIFQIEDNGVGFPAQYVTQLFGAFRRLHSEKEFPGTGVGLATVKRIILKHAGRVWAKNREGGGAVFGFSLPVT